MNHYQRLKVKKTRFFKYIICNLSPPIFQIYISIICSAMILIHSYFGKCRRFFLPVAFMFPTSSLHVLLDTVLNQN